MTMPRAMKGLYAEEMKSLAIAPDIIMVMYVAKDGVTKEQMREHYKNILLPWLKNNEVTRAKCWIAQYDGLLSIIIQVNVYVGEWSEIQDIHELYRSREGALMEARLLSECYVDEV